MSMSTPYERGGREQQKARTKRSLVNAAQALIVQGITPTVEQAARAASVSRTTAYRYFPSQQALLVAAYPYIQRDSLLPADPPSDVVARLTAVVEAHTRQTVQNEAQLRTMLRLSLEAAPDQREQLLLRQGRAIGWIKEALSPLADRLSDEQLHRLALAIRSVEGIEALVWLTDVGRLPREEAVAIMRWSAQALLRQALDDDLPAGRRVRR
jgi:AcrR family transcriptional regulator